MNHIALTLHVAVAGEHAGGENHASLPFELARPDDEVGDAGFIFDRDENDARRRPWPLPDKHQTGHGETLTVSCYQEIVTGDDPLLRQIITEESDRVLPQRQADGRVVFHHIAPGDHRDDRNSWLDDLRPRRA